MKYLSIKIFILLLIISLSSCSNVPKEVKQVLKIAGENRIELQTVIDHYQAPKDSLKLKAAYFLITKEIPFGSYVDSSYDKGLTYFFDSLNDSLIFYQGKENEENFDKRQQIIESLYEKYELKYGDPNIKKMVLKKDIYNVKASFLIENIEYAFKAWDLPWSKKYDFNQFCQYILPYRSGKQYPNPWRKYFFNELQTFRDSIGERQDPIVVNKMLHEFMKQKKFIGMKEFYNTPQVLTGPSIYKYKIYGNCVSLSNLAQESMRAIGLPATEVLLNKFGDDGNDHIVNAVLTTSGDWEYFNPLSSMTDTFSFNEKLTKIYRKGLVDKNNLTSIKVKAIQKLNLFRWEDITKEVIKTYDIQLNISDVNIKKNKIAYLCIFDNRTQEKWSPIDWCLIDGKEQRIVFKDIGGKEVVYIAMADDEVMGLKPISTPFVLKKDGSLRYINPQKENISIQVTRKHPPKPHLVKIAKSLNGGRFEASNSSNFSKPILLFSLKDIYNTDSAFINIKANAYRYYRFVYPEIEEGKYYDMAELSFGNGKNNQFIESNGTHIASKGINEKIIKGLFDSDLLTYPSIYRKNNELKSKINDEIFSGLSEKVWVGIDLGSRKPISKIFYSPRTDKNGIYPNMQYELFYWTNSWTSAGTKKAKEGKLEFENIPKGSLLWLRNHTEGKEERIFTYENENQVWW